MLAPPGMPVVAAPGAVRAHSFCMTRVTMSKKKFNALHRWPPPPASPLLFISGGRLGPSLSTLLQTVANTHVRASAAGVTPRYPGAAKRT